MTALEEFEKALEIVLSELFQQMPSPKNIPELGLLLVNKFDSTSRWNRFIKYEWEFDFSKIRKYLLNNVISESLYFLQESEDRSLFDRRYLVGFNTVVRSGFLIKNVVDNIINDFIGSIRDRLLSFIYPKNIQRWYPIYIDIDINPKIQFLLIGDKELISIEITKCYFYQQYGREYPRLRNK